VGRCRTLYNGALEQRRAWWGRGQGTNATYDQQARELPERKGACPDYAAIHSHAALNMLRAGQARQAPTWPAGAGES
jgi:hypothetical protein